MPKRLEIITDVTFKGEKIGQILVTDLGREAGGFEMATKNFSDEDNFRISLIPDMGVSLRRYDSLLKDLQKDGYEFVQQEFKGCFERCNYKSKYAPNYRKS